MTARNASRRASDGRRSHARAYNAHLKDMRAATLYTDGRAVVSLVKNEPSPCKLVTKELTLIPGLLSVGEAGSPLVAPGFAVTFAGQPKRMSRQQVNAILELVQALKTIDALPRKAKTPPTIAESVPLLPAVCASSKKSTPLTFAIAA